MRIVLTGGGTGGHAYPAVSVGLALRGAEPDAQVLYVGSPGGPEARLAREAGIPFEAVESAPLRGGFRLSNITALARLVGGTYSARRVLRRFGPEIVFGTGGYTTAAVLVAARSLGCRIVIHEQNAVPGRTNRALARIADRVCISFPDSVRYFGPRKTVLTGMPIRSDFGRLPGRREARKSLNLDSEAFTILVMGGSQGARKLNELVLAAWPGIDDGTVQVLHQTGERNIQEVLEHPAVRSMSQHSRRRYHIKAYVDAPQAMAAADLIISRSGASTVAEIAAAGLPAVLFPYPHAYAMHQHHNARFLAEKGAAIICEEKNTDAEALAHLVNELRAKPERLREMSRAAASLARPGAAAEVASVILSLASRKGGRSGNDS